MNRTRANLSTLFLLLVALSSAGQAQTFTVLHSFTGGVDGANPWAGLTMDRAGNLYGMAESGGTYDEGAIFKLSHSQSGWTFDPLHSFAGSPTDGNSPDSPMVFGPDGSLYGVTIAGGTIGAGTTFNLKPPPRICAQVLCPWDETAIHNFPDPLGVDGINPVGAPLFDQAGNIFGVTRQGANGPDCLGRGCGLVYELSPAQGSWTERIIYNFGLAPDSNIPEAGLIFDAYGNLYGTACGGGTYNHGTVFQMTTTGVENILYNFRDQSDGQCPDAALIFDAAGNLYGTASDGGANGGGTAFELAPSNGSWNFVLLYSFSYHSLPSGLTRDSAGNLYGTTYIGGAGDYGAVFKLTSSPSGWVYTSLHDFASRQDGANPVSGVILDAHGNIYGTASQGAQQGCYTGCGTAWEITP